MTFSKLVIRDLISIILSSIVQVLGVLSLSILIMFREPPSSQRYLFPNFYYHSHSIKGRYSFNSMTCRNTNRDSSSINNITLVVSYNSSTSYFSGVTLSSPINVPLYPTLRGSLPFEI
jgi:hypothetical protein